MIDKRVGLRLCELTASLLGVLVCGAALAATITVNSLADPGAPGICALRDAITAANTMTTTNGCAAGTGNDAINFSVAGTITLSSLCRKLPRLHDDQRAGLASWHHDQRQQPSGGHANLAKGHGEAQQPDSH